MMNEVRSDLLINTSGFHDCSRKAKRIYVSAAPMNWVEIEAFGLYLLRKFAHARRNMHVVTGSLRRASHGQPMRDEIPVFRHQVEDLLRHQPPGLCALVRMVHPLEHLRRADLI